MPDRERSGISLTVGRCSGCHLGFQPSEIRTNVLLQYGAYHGKINFQPMATAPILEMEIQAENQNLTPPLPEALEDTGLARSVVEQLVMKLLYARGDMLGRDLSEALGLKFSLIEDIIEFLKRQHFIQAKASLGMGASTSVFAMTETGRNYARECLETNQYSGTAPVPLYQYTYIVRRQRRADGWLTKEALAAAYKKMVVS